mgnify:CR=1 FL=1
MLFNKCIHPQILSALGKMGHGSKILISDGGYPHITASPASAEKVYLNLTQGKLLVTEILETLKETVPIEKAAVMTPPDGTSQPVHELYRQIIPNIPVEQIKQFEFYEIAKDNNIALVIATGDMRNYANLLLTVGFIKHPEGKGNY